MPDEFEEKPDTVFFDYAHDFLNEKWQESHEDWRKRDEFYRRDYDVWNGRELNNTRASYKPSTSTSIIDHAADTQLAFNPSADRPAPKPGNQESIGWSDDIENRMVDILNDSSAKEVELPFKAAGKFLLHLGYAVLELGWEEDRQGEKGQSFNPVRIKAPHPSSVLLDWEEKNPPIGIKSMEMRASKLNAWTKRLAKPGNGIAREDVEIFKVTGSPFEMISLKYMWTNFWVMLKRSDGQPIFVMPNTWGAKKKGDPGFVPWNHAFAGYGMEQTDDDKRGPLYHAQGLLSPVIDTLKASAQAQSAKHQILIDRAYPQEGTSRDPDEVAENRARGGLLEGDQTEYWLLERAALGGEFFRVGEEYDNEIALGTYNRALAGFRQQGVDTVGQQAIMSTAAAKKFNVPAIQMQYMASQTASNILRMVDTLNVAIGLNGKKITKNIVEEDYTIDVSFEVVDPVLQIQKREMGLKELAAGVKSRARYWREDSRLEDISAERDALDRDLADTHPAILHVRGKRAAAEMGEDLDAAIQEQEVDDAAARDRASSRARTTTNGRNGPDRNVPADNTLLREGLTGDVPGVPRIPFGQPGG